MKRNKFQWIIILLLMVWVNTIVAQLADSSDNFKYASEVQLEYLQNVAEKQEKELWELSQYKEYIRWKNNFETKLDKNGNMSGFGGVVYDYYENNIDAISDMEFDWEYNCPDSLWSELVANSNGSYAHEGAGQHLIISLWINPNDMNHILAGCQFTGGLWSTTNGGDSWENLTEDYPLIQGLSSIYVNPNDSTTIFVTSAYDSEGPRGYNHGLYYTIDNGDTWYIDSCYTYDPWDDSWKHLYPGTSVNYSPRAFLQNYENDSVMYLTTPYRVLVSTDVLAPQKVGQDYS